MTLMPDARPQDVCGFWKTVDKKRGFTTSVIAVYEYEGKIYGQVIIGNDEKTGALIDTFYDPVQVAEKLKSKPFLERINIFWGLEPRGEKYGGGTVFDPRTGWRFACELWTEDGFLVLRGLIGPFGKNVLFHPAVDADFPPGFLVPDLGSFVPVVPVK